ncbi:hypothetical protein Acr_09g0008480 [Actinidia rufa]|uniref:Uncharacterized protein n=1 Tax=Actinidia rufa TaxID=165716 RepID=A0A7J0F6Q8_9ERIC|nr:hypothetical protein Acr_09g0008480 [Actinidia rufa]
MSSVDSCLISMDTYKKKKEKSWTCYWGLDSTVDPKAATSLKLDASAKEFTGFFSSVGGRGSDSPMSSSSYDFPKMTGVQGGMETSFGIQRVPSSSWSSRMRLLDVYMQNSSHDAFGSGERRYSSLQLPPSSEGNDYQPATVHDNQIASYLSRVQNGLSTMKPPSFPDPVVPRKISLQFERPFNFLSSAGPAENLNTAVNAKKFHSLPDISGLSLPLQNSYLSGRRARLDSPIGYGPSLYASPSMKARAPLAFDDLSPSK